MVGYSKWRAALGEPEKPLIWHTDVLFACADGRQEPLINMLWGLGIGLTPVIAEHAAYLAPGPPIACRMVSNLAPST